MMHTQLSKIAIASLVSLAFTAFVPSLSKSSVPPLVGFQGILRDGGGNPVPNGSYSVVFTIYDASSGGNAVWSETESVTTAGGQFALLLGSVTPIPDSAFSGPSRFLGVKVDTDPEMTPRQQMVSLGYAFRVNSVDGATGGLLVSKLTIGTSNSNTGSNAFVTGINNTVSGQFAVIAGGSTNSATASGAAVGGGVLNRALAPSSVVGGGSGNVALGDHSVVAGGDQDSASGYASAVGGGEANRATGIDAAIAGGEVNRASGRAAFIGAGTMNLAAGDRSVVAGGQTNEAQGRMSSVLGGFWNHAVADYSVVAGGRDNWATGTLSFAAGYRATANHKGTFVWADSTEADFTSTAANQFLIRASGGVGIGTDSPQQPLHVVKGGTNFVTANGNSVAVFENNNTAYISVLAPANAERGILFGDIQDAAKGGIIYNGTNNRMEFRTNFNDTKVSITSTGAVGIGTIAPAATLHVNGTAGNNTGVWSFLSDRRLKRDIEPMQHALEAVERLQPVSFRWKDSEKDAQFGRVRGLIAQDVEKVIPEWVKTDPNGYKRLEPIGVDALLIEAIKEQQGKINAQKVMIESLQTQVDELRSVVQKLAAMDGSTGIVTASAEASR